MVTHRISANNYTRHRTLLWFPTEADQQAFLLFTSSSGNNRDEDLDQFASSVSLQKLVPRILQRPLSGVSSNEELPLGKGLLALKLFAQSPSLPVGHGSWRGRQGRAPPASLTSSPGIKMDSGKISTHAMVIHFDNQHNYVWTNHCVDYWQQLGQCGRQDNFSLETPLV